MSPSCSGNKYVNDPHFFSKQNTWHIYFPQSGQKNEGKAKAEVVEKTADLHSDDTKR